MSDKFKLNRFITNCGIKLVEKRNGTASNNYVLDENGFVVSLELSDLNIRLDILSHLIVFIRLRKLKITFCSFSNISVLRGLKQLIDLDLSNNESTPKSINFHKMNYFG